jgi:hypothetical protein
VSTSFLLRFQDQALCDLQKDARAGAASGSGGGAGPAPLRSDSPPAFRDTLPATLTDGVGPVAQTKTVTNVKAEADDNDPRQNSLRAIPPCS